MSSTEDVFARRRYLPRLEAAEVALRALPVEWRTDRDVEAVRNKLESAVRVLKDLN